MWKYNKYIQYSTNCGMLRATCTNTFIHIYEYIENSTHIYLNTSLWQLHPFHYCHSHIFCCATFTAFCLAYASIHKYYLVIVASSSLFTCNNSNQRHCNCCWILKITQRATCHQFFTVALVCFTRNFFLPSFQLVCVCVFILFCYVATNGKILHFSLYLLSSVFSPTLLHVSSISLGSTSQELYAAATFVLAAVKVIFACAYFSQITLEKFAFVFCQFFLFFFPHSFWCVFYFFVCCLQIAGFVVVACSCGSLDAASFVNVSLCSSWCGNICYFLLGSLVFIFFVVVGV